MRRATLWHYLGVLFIMFWGLAPFYWMVIVALRDKRYTFDTSPWQMYVTQEDFQETMATE